MAKKPARAGFREAVLRNLTDMGDTVAGYGRGAQAIGEDVTTWARNTTPREAWDQAINAGSRALAGLGVAGMQMGQRVVREGPEAVTVGLVSDVVNPLPAIREAAAATSRAKRSGGRDDWKAATLAALGAASAVTPAGKAGRGARTGAEALADAGRGLKSPRPGRVAFATHEDTPGVMTGHLPKVVAADEATRRAYAADPRSGWRDAEGRDVLYKAQGRDLAQTQEAVGVYTPPGGVPEVNPAHVARPRIEVQNGAVSPQDRAALDSGEAFRAYMDAQGAGAWHAPIFDAPPADLGSLYVPHSGPLDIETIQRLREAGGPRGVGDVLDTGGGATMTVFYPDSPPTGAAMQQALDEGFAGELEAILGRRPHRANIDGGYLGYEDVWWNPNGGHATRRLFENLSPEARQQLDTPEVRASVLAKAERDDDWAARTGDVVRSDVQRARRAFGREGFTGLETLLRYGIAPGLALAILAGADREQPQGPGV